MTDFRPVGLPFTVYGVSLLYQKQDKHVLCSQLVIESGENPLLLDEVCARAGKALAAVWKESEHGPMAVWTLTTKACDGRVMKRQ